MKYKDAPATRKLWFLIRSCEIHQDLAHEKYITALEKIVDGYYSVAVAIHNAERLYDAAGIEVDDNTEIY